MGFNYEQFEKDLLVAVEEYAKSHLDIKDDMYIMSLEYFPDFTTGLTIRANTYSYLNSRTNENDKYYLDFKYNEEEWDWDIFDNLDILSKLLQTEYNKQEEQYENGELLKLCDEQTLEKLLNSNDIIYLYEKDELDSFYKSAIYIKLSELNKLPELPENESLSDLDIFIEYKDTCFISYDDINLAFSQQHADRIFDICNKVMKAFKKTDTYKAFPNLCLNTYIREYFDDDYIIKIFGELNNEESVQEYSRWL